METSDLVTLNRDRTEGLSDLVYNMLTTSEPAKVTKTQWSNAVLALTVDVLDSQNDLHEQSFNELYSFMVSTIPNQVRTRAEEEGLSEEKQTELSEGALNKVQQCNDPFRNISTCIHYDSECVLAIGLLEEATKEGATWNGVMKLASGHVDAFKYHEDRLDKVLHYTEGKGENKRDLSFVIRDCIAPRDKIAELEAQVKALKADWSSRFNAVTSDYRANEQAGLMQDNRTKAERNRIERRIADALYNGLTVEDRERLYAEHVTQ